MHNIIKEDDQRRDKDRGAWTEWTVRPRKSMGAQITLVLALLLRRTWGDGSSTDAVLARPIGASGPSESDRDARNGGEPARSADRPSIRPGR
jgi:hypothetical protein